MNRLKLYMDGEEAPDEQYGDFVVISGTFGFANLSLEEAERVERLLDRRCVPEWVVFHDRAGSRVRVKSDQIRCLCESTAAQRAADRRYDRARRQEEKADRMPWEDDD